ncbi:MAG: FGGY-family carbohydrate kinase [Clostridia bacterium]
MSYIGLDVGTSGCKAAVFREDGVLLSAHSRRYDLDFPQKGWVELNPNVVWTAVCAVLSDVAPDAADARAISVSSIGEALIFVDAQDKVLANSIVYLDERCPEMVARVEACFDPEALHHLTGVPINQMYSLCRYLWMREHAPHILERAKFCFLFGDYITYKLCGVRAIDPSTASRTMLFDVEKRRWAESLFNRFEIPILKFSPVCESGTQLHEICPEIASRCNLPSALQVVVGCHDQVAATLGSGVLKSGELLAGEGSSESLNLIVDAASIDMRTLFSKQICLEPFVVPGTAILPIGQLSHGTCIKWFVQAHQSEYTVPGNAPHTQYARAEELCAEDCGELLFLPYLSRSNCMDASSRAPACFLGIDISTDVHKMYRAVLEGLAFESRMNFHLFADAGAHVDNITASGGGAQSERLMQIKADVLGVCVTTLCTKEAGVAGLAMICARARAGIPYADAARQFVQTDRTFQPKRDYSSKFARYCHMNEVLKALYRQI